MENDIVGGIPPSLPRIQYTPPTEEQRKQYERESRKAHLWAQLQMIFIPIVVKSGEYDNLDNLAEKAIDCFEAMERAIERKLDRMEL